MTIEAAVVELSAACAAHSGHVPEIVLDARAFNALRDAIAPRCRKDMTGAHTIHVAVPSGMVTIRSGLR